MSTFRRGLRLILSISIFEGLILNCSHAATVACPQIPPPRSLELKSMYVDSKSSIKDKANEQENAKTMRPIFDFFKTIEQALDGQDSRPGNQATDCAFGLFRQWAFANALTFEPAKYEGQGKVKRGLIHPSFEMIAIKFRAAGYVLDAATQAWLKKMDDENIDFYEKGSNRANQRVWAAAGAALNCVLGRDSDALRFQDQVWREAIDAIRDDGYIEAELGRDQQALVYHIYSFAATLVLERAREALGYKLSINDRQKLNLLSAQIGRTLCDPESMRLLAGAPIRIPDGEWAYVVTNGFGGQFLDANWTRCGLPMTDFNARDMGGDSRKSAEILAELAKAQR